MPCNLQAELMSAITSNVAVKAIHQKYLTSVNEIILKMDRCHCKYYDRQLDWYLAISKGLIDDFSIAEKLLIALLDIPEARLSHILSDCAAVQQLLTDRIDKIYIY